MLMGYELHLALRPGETPHLTMKLYHPHRPGVSFGPISDFIVLIIWRAVWHNG